ncbi:response regulator with CheY-like receiver, AAA-type ATPase, and DNA-binding domains [Terriglobus roseus DSM 18391]|uniref:Response regulator with CheY-like receiver, AAA-type ATPase, and DNA-binding domains n=1 Tax=Terriglobus roseus (strain DSM 18391 / NRRL B-41598 / KBS 63) TaxID=926566 RepID=I3ZGT7_TERRK|nr:sigma-54 dependent transcriptional regulator [Terriglobus roseus]AFL88455.1 response regulator with CheY-like receiver, AAA-type ATPase, and DNA-binding domains [Terriglobus roseus DSM 18391]AFL88797.1 response regulator with CheY-like receiver, AAA-type ATPase, and DNA-binding domains [Terriglobus roseus DSM 18391]
MSELIRAVIIDDNLSSLELLTAALEQKGVALYTASDPVHGLDLVRTVRPQLVITDLVMPGLSGLEVLRQIMVFAPSTNVILMTAHYTTETAVEAIRNGAADYLQKPVKIADLRERVRLLLTAAESRRLALSDTAAHMEDLTFEGLIAKSAAMWRLFAMMEKIAPHYRTLLIHGETGTGKDLVARAVHARSRTRGSFVVLNCSAVVETLFESELFGHTRGAFTGADRDKEGLFAAADGGTLFLDEIGDMPMSTQAKLLRAIQNQEIYKIGSLVPRRVHVKVIAASHRDLKQAAKEGQFREDLFYRLSMVELKVPPLRERREDIELLTGHFVERFASEYRRKVRGVTPRAQLVLNRYDWPGNVRQLEHVIARSCMLADSELIDVEDLPDDVVDVPSTMQLVTASLLVNQERLLLQQIFNETNGNQSETARRLGIGRDALRYKLKKHGLGC